MISAGLPMKTDSVNSLPVSLGRLPWRQGAGWTASLLLHLFALAGLARGGGHVNAQRRYAPAQVDFTVLTRPQVPPTVSPATPPPSREPVPARASGRTAPQTPPRPLPGPTPAVRSEPVDLTGVTLTNLGDGASWSSVVGNGSPMDGALGPIGAKAAPILSAQPPERSATVRVPKKAEGPTVVPVSDLSRRPVPPRLDGVLRSHYPTVARQRGVSGSALIRLRIEADGKVRIARIASESFAGFGEACRSTVLGSSWLPPLDREGRPAATEVNYTCRFEVERQ